MSQTNGAGLTVSYVYDLYGNRTSITYPNGKNGDLHLRRRLNRMSTVTDLAGNVTTYTYNADSQADVDELPAPITATDRLRRRWGGRPASSTAVRG